MGKLWLQSARIGAVFVCTRKSYNDERGDDERGRHRPHQHYAVRLTVGSASKNSHSKALAAIRRASSRVSSLAISDDGCEGSAYFAL
jgi:hypothetical protein